MRLKFFSFFGQTTLPPIVLTPCGHVVSILDAIRKNEEISTSFNFFLLENTFSAFFLFKNLTVALSVFLSLLQGTILNFSRLTLIFCKTLSTNFLGISVRLSKGCLRSPSFPSSNTVPICDAVFQVLRVCCPWYWMLLAKLSRCFVPL